ncbi:hypothetical protein ACSYG7_13620 [Bacillus velezensis]|uniref:hypothetical protein n=1 Tax=Bacillus velezensis TaxID=492670 RepID=UPI001EF102AF|nr:hypothetical protein [Bacillus velezensis]ULH21323.1 hypothetical protein MF598_06570 [Bacillus velezensis]UUT26287.1 hypothetical protein NRF11_13770 [Bacillus velezensis]
MKEYVKIIELSHMENVNRYIQEGWEVIDTLKRNIMHEEEVLNYVIGYPIKKRVEDLKEIIKAYEEKGLKEELFKGIAEDNGENYTEIHEGAYQKQNETSKFMNKYEKALDSKIEYGLVNDVQSFDF